MPTIEQAPFSRLDELKAAIKVFEKAQRVYAKYGAYDTEPSAVFQQALHRALAQGENEVQNDPRYWQLYTSSRNCDRAAQALYETADAVVTLILDARIKGLPEISEYLNDYCWRV